MERILDELDGEERRPALTSLKHPSGSMLALRLKGAAKGLDLLLRLAVHLVDSGDERSAFVPAHRCNRRSSKQVAKREEFA